MTEKELEILCNNFITFYGEILVKNTVQARVLNNKAAVDIDELFDYVEEKSKNVFLALGKRWLDDASLTNKWNNDFVGYINSYISYVPYSITEN